MIRTKTILDRSDYIQKFDEKLALILDLCDKAKALKDWKLAGDAQFVLACIVYDEGKLSEEQVEEMKGLK